MISDLAASHKAEVNIGERSAPPLPIRRHLKAGRSTSDPARAGVVRSAYAPYGKSNPRRVGEPEIIASARQIVIADILEIIGRDIPDPRAHQKYLESLSLTDLHARKQQLLQEQLPMQLNFSEGVK